MIALNYFSFNNFFYLLTGYIQGTGSQMNNKIAIEVVYTVQYIAR